MSNATGRFSTRWDPAKTKGRSDAQLAGITPTHLLHNNSDTQDADIENLSKVQNARPLKPPRKRSA